MTDDTLPAVSLFDSVVGQPGAVEFLRSAARTPLHAYLFCGVPGYGTHAAARAFAAALVCPNGGCGTCDWCQQALSDRHPDVAWIVRTGASLAVDDAREVVKFAQRHPYVASRQVLIVPDVHLAVQASPVLLKTIEEPPGDTVFLLIADDLPPGLSTVASRCIEVAFPPVPDRAIADFLIASGCEAARAATIADGADGDVDRAALLVGDDGYAARLELWRSVPSQLDGNGASAGALARAIIEVIDGALEPLRTRHADEVSRLEEEAKLMGERGVTNRKAVTVRQRSEERRWRAEELRVGLAVLARSYRDRLADLVERSGAPGDRLSVAESARSLCAAVDLIGHAARSLRRNPQETLLLESLLMRLGKLDT